MLMRFLTFEQVADIISRTFGDRTFSERPSGFPNKGSWVPLRGLMGLPVSSDTTEVIAEPKLDVEKS